MAKSDKKYYWLRLQKDFFKRHDIRIVESMPNGKDYILFYLKVICESANHGGNLRFSETIPYSEEMLATITNTNVDVVRNAIKIFQELNMIEVLDNGTYFMHEVQNMVGYETEWAIKKREYRKKVNAQNVLQSENNAIKALKGGQYEDNVLNVRTNKGQCPKKEDNVRQEKEIEIEIEKEIDNNDVQNSSDFELQTLDLNTSSTLNEVSNTSKKTSNKQLKEEFETLWALYPRKQGKQDAFKKYIKYRNDKDDPVTFEEVKSGIENYNFYISKNELDINFVKMGSTWFNQKSWEDDYTVVFKNENSKKENKMYPDDFAF